MQRSCHLCVRLVRLYALPPSLTTNMGRYSQLSSKDWTAWQTKKKASHLLQSCTIAIGCEAIETQSTWPPKILSWEAATETHGHWVFLAGCHLSKSITIKFGVKLCSFESGLVKNLYQCHPFAFGLFSPLYYLSRYTCSWHFHYVPVSQRGPLWLHLSKTMYLSRCITPIILCLICMWWELVPICSVPLPVR